MSTEIEIKCPQNVLELKQKRSREQGKLQALLDRVQKKLDKASAGEEAPFRDVTAAAATAATLDGEEVAVLPYYLLQPKAKSGPPRYPPYLGSSAQRPTGLAQGQANQSHWPLKELGVQVGLLCHAGCPGP